MAIVACALLVSACSGSAETTSTTTTLSPPITTSTTAGSTSTTSSTTGSTTTTTLPEGTVGDPALLLQKIEEGTIGLENEFGVDPSDVPVPDLTNPDPLVAMEEILKFDIWVFQNAPRRGLIEVYTEPLTPAWKSLFSAVEGMNGGVIRFEDDGGLTVSTVRSASPVETDTIPQDILAEVPANSAVVWYTYSADPFAFLDTEGEIRELSDGWTDRSYLAILSPSPHGWLLHWEERQ